MLARAEYCTYLDLFWAALTCESARLSHCFVLVLRAGPHRLHHLDAVVAVVDIDPDRRAALAADVGSKRAGAAVVNTTSRNYSASVPDRRGVPCLAAAELSAEVLAGCDAVFVGTPPGSHARITAAALRAGRHVLLEKPLAATGGDADAIVAAADAAEPRGLFVGVDIGMRWNAALHELRRLAVDAGELGPLQSARLELHFRRWPRDWQVAGWVAGRSEGGPLREVGTHFIFGILELFGPKSVARVRCEVSFPGPPAEAAAETRAEGVIELATGLPISLSVLTDGTGRAADGGDHYVLEVSGDAGVAELYSFTSLRVRQLGSATAPKVLVENASYGRAESVKSLVEAATTGKSSSLITARQARDAQRVLDALLGSNGTWVEVDYS